MIDKKFWKKVFETQNHFDEARRIIIGNGAEALHASKQAIFALQRDNAEEAREKLDQAMELLHELEDKYGDDFRLRMEGSWKAAVEECMEAALFEKFISGQPVKYGGKLSVEADEYIGALSDVTGEIVRMMVLWTTKKQFDLVRGGFDAIDDIIHQLMQNNFSGYLRTKFDQAKNSLRKAEEIIYDISIREK